MKTNPGIPRMPTGVPNLDAILQGGLPSGSVTVVSGPPGSGKTILAQQICFHNASSKHRALYLGTLTEPTAKTLRYMKQFTFFDQKRLEESVHFVDLGVMLRTKGLEQAASLIMTEIKRIKPAIVVIDSFKVFDDLAKSSEELRKFGYEITVNLMAWEATTLLLGEYSPADFQTNPLFSIVDGLVAMTHREFSGEHQRFIQVLKMRGTDHSSDENPFIITPSGIEIFAPRVTIRREPAVDPAKEQSRCRTGVSKLDDLLGEGIPRGSSLLVAGVAGTGKTVLLLEFVYRGALAGEKGILFSFEETEDRLRSTARGLGWELDREIDRGMVEIVFIPQPNIMVERHLLMMRQRIETMGARRVAVDSVSVFLHRVKDAEASREKVFQLASIVQNSQSVGLFATDIPYGSKQISRFGVEETVVDGVILLTASEDGMDRDRYIEIYKLRNTAHLKGRHNVTIGAGGMQVFPRYLAEPRPGAAPSAMTIARRLATGVPGLDALLGGGLFERSATLISGSAGIGKTTLGIQFLLEGAAHEQPGLYVSLEEGPAQVLAGAQSLGLPLDKAVDGGLIDIVYLSREHVRAAQFVTILSDRVQRLGARRLVIDGASHFVSEDLQGDELRQLLHNLVARFRAMGVTTVFTLESPSMYSTETVTDRLLSPVADNLIMLRYQDSKGRLTPSLTVVKTRGSSHDMAAHALTIDRGGLRLGGRPA